MSKVEELKEHVQYRTGKTPDNIRALIQAFEELKDYALDISNNYDCDEDAHRHNRLWSCRVCKTEMVLERVNELLKEES